jgi:hypothetical protein
MSDEPAEWPDDDEDPFAPTSSTEEEAQDEPVETDTEQESTDVTEEDTHTSSEIESPENIANQWTLPVRVAPILSMSGEEVAEFPLNESLDGRKNTSLIVSDNLIRVIEATYDDDGQRRLNVKAVLKNELTGFSHNHNELMHKHQWMWVSSFLIGLIASSFIPFIGFFGQILLAVGIIGWVYMHLEVHTLEFSTSGSKHKVAFTGYGSNRPMFRASMALIGPTIAKYMDTGEFDTESIVNLHESLAIPAPPPPQKIPPITIEEQLPNQVAQLEQPAPPTSVPPPPPVQPEEIPGPPTSAPPPPPVQPEEIPEPPTSAPPPPTKIPSLGPPLSAPPPPSPAGPPPPPPLPPATLPPPLPPGSMMSPPPPLGLDRGEIPLDAPLPDAPEISVTAAPIEESLSADEKNELLEELK